MKKLLSIYLAAAVFISLLTFTAKAGFTDIPDEETQIYASILEQLGVVNGVGAGRFEPYGKLTRSQFCKMAVCILDEASAAAQYANSSVFTDVRASHWASGYIHYCVKKNMIFGTGDGSFAPDRELTYAEAVTILMRMLGYKDSDFSAPWPNGYISGAASAGLSKGLDLRGGDKITRAQAARLFVNLLITKMTTGDIFASAVFGGLSEAVLITGVSKNTVEAFDGTKITALKTANGLDNAFIGRSCRFITDKNNSILTAIPVEEAYIEKKITVSSAKYTYVLDTDGVKNYIGDKTVMYMYGTLTEYTDVWLDIKPGAPMTIYFDMQGAARLVLMDSTSGSDAEAVVLTAVPSTLGRLAVLFGLDPEGNYTLYKNGSRSAAGDLAVNDVVTYNKNSRAFYASDFRISAFYEMAWPNFETPVKMTVFGKEFDLTQSAQIQLASFEKNTKLTVSFTEDMRIASVMSASVLTAKPVALAREVSGDSAKLIFLNGYTLTAPYTNNPQNAQKLEKTLVTVDSNASGKVTLSALTLKAPLTALDTAARKLGTAQLAASCAIYDSIGGNCVTPVSLDDIAFSSVPAADILHAEYDSAGRVTMILLDDVTGNCYTYGRLDYGRINAPTLDGSEIYYPAIGVKTSAAEPMFFQIGAADESIKGKWGGAATGGQKVYSLNILTSANCGRNDFSNGYVIADGKVIPLADNLLVYIKDTDNWEATLTQARTYSDNLTVYFDRAPDDGGCVRVVIAN